MALYYQTEGLVFKKKDRFDADKVFSVFTKDFGKVEITGKAIRKITSKLRAGIEVFTFSDIEFIQGRNKKTLTDAMVKEKFQNIIENPERFSLAVNISEVIDNFIKGQEKDDALFDLFHDIFSKINDSSASFLLYLYFFWNFIFILGHSSEFLHCASCQKNLEPNGLCFSNQDGGVICKSCASQKKDCIKINANTVKIVRLILKKEWDVLLKLKINDDTQKSLRKISDSYYQYLLSLA